MTEYKLKDNSFKMKLATVDTKATGNPSGHLTAKTGQMVVSFPFDCGGNFTGSPFSVVLPSHVFYEHFEEVVEKPKRKAVK